MGDNSGMGAPGCLVSLLAVIGGCHAMETGCTPQQRVRRILSDPDAVKEIADALKGNTPVGAGLPQDMDEEDRKAAEENKRAMEESRKSLEDAFKAFLAKNGYKLEPLKAQDRFRSGR